LAAEITLHRVTDADLPLLHRWLAEPHVRAWWGDPDEEIALIREGEASGESEGYVAHEAGEPVAYLQSWRPTAHDEEEWFATVPHDAVGIDMFVGPPERIGRGVGPRVLRAFARHLVARGATRLIIDPDAANTRAVRAYAKAGFRRFAVAGRDKDIILMELAAERPEEIT
jgi:aminoglycoside 6'-N-acetyltransferase